MSFGWQNTFCGCWYVLPAHPIRVYLSQVELEAHTTILATTSSTKLRQTFINPQNETLKEVSYTFPLYDGVSVGGFTCRVGNRVITGVVKERTEARKEYQDAISKGWTAGLLEQNSDAADVFTTSLGNVEAGEQIVVEITYLGELKNDAESNGARFTIPTQIAPRYGSTSSTSNAPAAIASKGIKITVDISLDEGTVLRGIQSPSHPISTTIGRLSTSANDDTFDSNNGSMTLALGSTELDKDFVVIIQAKDQDTPRALLETHPSFPNQRVLMTTLVPKFNLPNESPEIIFVVDRSGSMGGKMHLVIEALKIFLKSLPVAVKFNICSFGSRHTFLFDRSRTYDEASLRQAMDHIQPHHFQANYGGTEVLAPIQDAIRRRYSDMSLEIMLLTDGEVWNQDVLFAAVNKASEERVRFFTLGIGSGASSALVEGIARGGKGFAQWANDGERIDKSIVRMLKAALTPHIKYKLEVKYESKDGAEDDDYEIVESFEKSMQFSDIKILKAPEKESKTKKFISLFSPNSKDEPTNPERGRYDHLPEIPVPNIIQTPHELPPLYPHSRTTVYLLLSPGSASLTPSSVIISGTSVHGDLELEIPIRDVGLGTTLHQLAAKKAMQELEEGRGWLTKAKGKQNKPLKTLYEGNWDLIIEREAVRLGTLFQVAGKFCSFVAVADNGKDVQDLQHQPSMGKNELADYQMGLMLLQQQNKGRRMMASTTQHQSNPPPPPRARMAMSAPQGPFSSSSAFGGSVQAQKSSAPPPAPGGALMPRAAAFGASALGSARSATKKKVMRGGELKSQERQASISQRHDPSADAYSPDFSTGESDEALQNFDFDKFLDHGNAPASFDMNSRKASPKIVNHKLHKELQAEAINSVQPLENMQKLVELQDFTGFWKISSTILGILSHNGLKFDDQADIIQAVRASCSGKLDAQALDNASIDFFVTAMVVAWLETVVPEEQDVWEMIVEKAKGWLEGHLDGSDQVKELVEASKNLYVHKG